MFNITLRVAIKQCISYFNETRTTLRTFVQIAICFIPQQTHFSYKRILSVYYKKLVCTYTQKIC